MARRDDIPLPDVAAVAEALGMDLWTRLMRRAQKAVLLRWRDRRDAPGLLARFEHAAMDFYDFTARRGWARRRGKQNPFMRSGGLRRMMANRKPRSRNSGDDRVRSTIPIGGGALNFLGAMKGATVSVSRGRAVVGVRAHSVAGYARTRGGLTHGVAAHARPAHLAQRQIVMRVVNEGHRTYAQEWADLTRDLPWLAAEIATEFLAIVRSAAYTKTGRLKPSFTFPRNQALDDDGEAV